jgi:hypothetical protein
MSENTPSVSLDERRRMAERRKERDRRKEEWEKVTHKILTLTGEVRTSEYHPSFNVKHQWMK